MKNTFKNSFMPLSLTANKQIFTKFTFNGQRFVKKWRAEFHENPKNILVANSQTDRLMDVRDIHTRRSFFPS